MNEFKTITVNGYCPYYDNDYTISAKFQKHNWANDSTNYAKCVGYNCDSSHKCQQGNNCPVAIKAQEITRW